MKNESIRVLYCLSYKCKIAEDYLLKVIRYNGVPYFKLKKNNLVIGVQHIKMFILPNGKKVKFS